MVGGSLPGKRIAVWGLTFKAGTNDVRSSPAIKIVEALQAQGAIICAYDPAIELSIEGIELVASKEEACLGADVLLVAAEWPEFAQADLEAISTLMSQKCIVDARNVIDQHSASFAGFEYTGVGRGNSTNRVVEVAR
jgi:UDPglucose 6-dehydrogenase